MVQELASILQPLCETIFLEKKYEDAGYLTAPIGIGTFHTWHGSPDMRLTGLTDATIAVLVRPSEKVEELTAGPIPVEELTAVPVPAELKNNTRASSRSVLSQLVGLTVTSAFTNLNLHGVHVTVALLMCNRRVRLCIYDCTNDLLSLSDEICLMVQPHAMEFY